MAPSSSSRAQTTQIVLIGFATVLTLTALWYVSRPPATKKAKTLDDADGTKKPSKSRGLDSVAETNKTTTTSAQTPQRGASSSTTPAVGDQIPVVRNSSTTITSDEKELHQKIEQLDQRGKAFFKNKQYLEAAQAFTEALALVGEHREHGVGSASLQRQTITLYNNRSAMYEKAEAAELALQDCQAILELDIHHTKARTRKLRILEAQKRWYDALIEVCALQLLFMQANKNNFRLGLPVPPPPVPHNKMEEIVNQIIPDEMAKYTSAMNDPISARPLPSPYTILQLLKSYTEYPAWMAKAARDGSVDQITTALAAADEEGPATRARQASMLLKRGRRHVYDRHYAAANQDFREAYALVENDPEAQGAMVEDDYARLLEWTGMVRHWNYDLTGAMECYQKCADLEPTNTLLLVKQAGVLMDDGKHEEALKAFDTALGLSPDSVDALLHRSNLRMLQGKPEQAKVDLEKCVALRPDHVMARLRLASILSALNDPSGARQQLDLAEKAEPKSSEVQSYRGELCFTLNEMDEAKRYFEKAIALEPSNPTPYVNAAMALLNTPPPPGQLPDAASVMQFLEQAIAVDPQFTAAYIQLGQIKLGTATDLNTAREVVTLYDQSLQVCRSKEEIKELCSMRILAVAQIEAATMLGMETFNLQ